jgi:SnoaL-like domain
MSQKHVEVVRALGESWNAGDRSASAIAEYCDPALELNSPLSSVVGDAYRGYTGMGRWMADIDEQFSEWRISLDDVREVGSQVIAIGTVHARGRASGIALQFQSATVFHFGSDDRVMRIRIYPDVNEALEAVGLRE